MKTRIDSQQTPTNQTPQMQPGICKKKFNFYLIPQSQEERVCVCVWGEEVYKLNVIFLFPQYSSVVPTTAYPLRKMASTMCVAAMVFTSRVMAMGMKIRV